MGDKTLNTAYTGALNRSGCAGAHKCAKNNHSLIFKSFSVFVNINIFKSDFVLK